jgi:hypothetical protein
MGEDVDGRDEPGHDDLSEIDDTASTIKPYSSLVSPTRPSA